MSEVYDPKMLCPPPPQLSRRTRREEKARLRRFRPSRYRAKDRDIAERKGVEEPETTGGELAKGGQRGEAVTEDTRAGMRDVGASDRWDGYERIIEEDQYEITVGYPCPVDDLTSLMEMDEAEEPPANEDDKYDFYQLLYEEYEVPIFMEDAMPSSDRRAFGRER